MLSLSAVQLFLLSPISYVTFTNIVFSYQELGFPFILPLKLHSVFY